jgi:hypothetical protein
MAPPPAIQHWVPSLLNRQCPCIPPTGAHAHAQMHHTANASRASRAAMRAQFSSC